MNLDQVPIAVHFLRVAVSLDEYMTGTLAATKELESAVITEHGLTVDEDRSPPTLSPAGNNHEHSAQESLLVAA
ncbi:hypothetical protein [Rhodococcus sp. NPDC055024]